MTCWYSWSRCLPEAAPMSGPMSGHPEVPPDAGEGVEERVDLTRCGVHGQARARARADAEAPVDRLRAVVPDPDGDAGGVQDLPDVVRVDAVDGHADGAHAVLGAARAQDP